MEEGGRSFRQSDVAMKTGWSDEIDGFEDGRDHKSRNVDGF